MVENIVVGLVSGLFVSFLVLVIGKLWRAVIEPWIEERVYKDLHIEGKWYSLYVESGDYRQEAINLKRHGHAIKGEMICKHGADDGEGYSLCGSFRNLLLPLTYESTDSKKSDRGTITLKSAHNGQRLVGEVAMYETKRDFISTAKVIWFRDKEELNKTIEYIKKNREKLKVIREKEFAVQEEFSKFFKEFSEEYARKKKKEQEENEPAIEGEAKRISHDG
jgi:hypothetical protein